MSELPESTHYRLKASFYSVYLVVCWLHLLQLKPIHHCSFLTKGGSFLPVCWVKPRQCKWLFKGLLYVFDWDSPSLIKKKKHLKINKSDLPSSAETTPTQWQTHANRIRHLYIISSMVLTQWTDLGLKNPGGGGKGGSWWRLFTSDGKPVRI